MRCCLCFFFFFFFNDTATTEIYTLSLHDALPICRRKGGVLAAFAPDQFHLDTPRDDITVYTFGNHAIRHQFCRICGCAPFAEGAGPDGEAMVVVNLRCAEDIDLSLIRIIPFDGASL